ncbi:MAG: hypothetical protein ABIS68_05740 [Casimicrobiaceae bacterium]
MNMKQIALSAGLALALVGSHAFAANPEKDNAFAMQLAEACDMDHTGMVTKANYMKMMEMKWDKMAKGAKELSVANTAKIFMDTSKASQ